jgi:tRNA U34 2-thiouridine synthase MnmA/TrmU
MTLVSREEFEALKKEVLEMKALLIKAKEYDERNNEPNCEMEDKVKLLKQVADMVGVDLKEIFGK